ncbi:MAG: type II toxin-antitoxin system HicB family antitoxin [Saprospiraceae bacterium]
MKILTAIIERNKDAYFAYIEQIDGCVAAGKNYEEVKTNLQSIIKIAMEEDLKLQKSLSQGYRLKFEVDFESVFDLIPEVNVSQLAITGKINPGLLRQYVSGTKRASETQAKKVMKAIKEVTIKLNSIIIATS